jgi:hypothetical protein
MVQNYRGDESLSGDWGVANTSYQTILDRGAIVQNIRTRFTVAQVNVGAELLPAVAGFGYRMVACTAISVGGAASATTTVDVLGTLSSSRKLVAYAQASLTENTVLTDGHTGAAVLAAGASYTTNDANTAINVGKTNSNVATATHIDINFSYVLEAV